MRRCEQRLLLQLATCLSAFPMLLSHGQQISTPGAFISYVMSILLFTIIRLNDPTILVRYNTLLVLTHLILNDMIKVKGQVSYMVMCLNDSSDEIRSLAELFFNELSKRSNNPVYNLLGDIIGNLSRDESESREGMLAAAQGHRELTQEEFQRTMNFLLSFVKKDKQADSLLERLLIRMSTAHSMKQKRYLAYCVSQIPMTEKGLRKLTEILKYGLTSISVARVMYCVGW